MTSVDDLITQAPNTKMNLSKPNIFFPTAQLLGPISHTWSWRSFCKPYGIQMALWAELVLDAWFGPDSTDRHPLEMEVSWNGGYPKSSIARLLDGIFNDEPSILGNPHLWKPPYVDGTVNPYQIGIDKSVYLGRPWQLQKFQYVLISHWRKDECPEQRLGIVRHRGGRFWLIRWHIGWIETAGSSHGITMVHDWMIVSFLSVYQI